jgi:hypothetical protein
MITASADFEAAVSRPSRTFHAVFLDAGMEVDAVVRKLIIHKGSCGESGFAPGAVFSSYIEAVLDNCDTALEGHELELKIGVKVDGTLASPTFEHIRIGFFTAGRPKTSTRRTEFTAYGRIQSMLSEKLFTLHEGSEIPTVRDVLDRIGELAGIYVDAQTGLNTSVSMNATFLSKALSRRLTCRDALAAAAFAVGGYATETIDGRVLVCKYSATVTAEYSAVDTMASPPAFHDSDTEITGVQVNVSDEITYTSGDPVNLEVDNAYISIGAFVEIAGNLIGLQYRGGEAVLALGDPRLEPWDAVRIIDTEENPFVLPCMSLAFTYDGGLQTTITAPSLEQRALNSLEKALAEAQRAADAAADVQARAEAGEFDAVTLRVDSTRGIVFKNNWYDTQLRVTVIKGSRIITDATHLHSEFGSGAYLQWSWRKQADQEWSAMSVNDSHITEGGFCLNVTPQDVDEQITFQCDLVV